MNNSLALLQVLLNVYPSVDALGRGRGLLLLTLNVIFLASIACTIVHHTDVYIG